MDPYTVNVSSIQDFMQCRFRWWCKWVMNRVPSAGATALDAGKLLHVIFEDHFLGRSSLREAGVKRCKAFRARISKEHEAARENLTRAVTVIEDLNEAFDLWEDTYEIRKVLEVEKPFTYPDPELSWLTWRGCPDRVIMIGNDIYHEQNRGLAASMNFGTYIRLQKRSYHEHLYGEYLQKKYCRPWKKKAPPKRKYGGTVFNLVRKLKFRTYVGKKNEKTKTAEEMFYQMPATYDMQGGLHQVVMMAARQHATAMAQVEREWREDGIIPAPNEKMNGGLGGNSEDAYFKVLIGETTLEDDKVFTDRKDPYIERDKKAA